MERRRVTIDVLIDQSSPLELETVAQAVANREQQGGIPDGRTMKQVKISLHHQHLPRLADVGLIEYDVDENTVVSCPSRSDLPL